MLTVETLDPTRNPARAKAFVEETGVRNLAVVFRAGDKKKIVTEDRIVEYDYSRARMGGEPTVKNFRGEQEFTSAILVRHAAEGPEGRSSRPGTASALRRAAEPATDFPRSPSRSRPTTAPSRSGRRLGAADGPARAPTSSSSRGRARAFTEPERGRPEEVSRRRRPRAPLPRRRVRRRACRGALRLRTEAPARSDGADARQRRRASTRRTRFRMMGAETVFAKSFRRASRHAAPRRDRPSSSRSRAR